MISPSSFLDGRCGADRLLAGEVDDRTLRSARLAVVTHAAAVTADLRPSIDGLLAAGFSPAAVVTPEHGFTGCGPPGTSEVAGAPERFGPARVVDGYLRCPAELAGELDGVEAFLVDVSDLGARCSTNLSLLDDVLGAAALLGARVTVLDRPRPIGPRRAGPVLDPALRSHVGRLVAPLRHGLTFGEAARRLAPDGLDLDVVDAGGGQPCPWVPPSPNLPTRDAAICYTGTVLFEGIEGAEPRGTTSPFQVVGADWLGADLVDALRASPHPGLALRATTMVPSWGRRRGDVLPALALHVTDAETAEPIAVVVELLAAAVASGRQLSFTPHFADVSGRSELAGQLLAGWDAASIAGTWAA